MKKKKTQRRAQTSDVLMTLISCAQAGRMFGKSESWVYKQLIDTGDLPKDKGEKFTLMTLGRAVMRHEERQRAMARVSGRNALAELKASRLSGEIEAEIKRGVAENTEEAHKVFLQRFRDALYNIPTDLAARINRIAHLDRPLLIDVRNELIIQTKALTFHVLGQPLPAHAGLPPPVEIPARSAEDRCRTAAESPESESVVSVRRHYEQLNPGTEP